MKNGLITGVENIGVELGSTSVLDVDGRYLLPGLVDTHVHINSPGRTEWEGFETATRAAAAGGCTCIVDMPLNSIPGTTNPEALEEKRRAAAGACVVDYAFWGGVVKGNVDHLTALAEAGVKGFKCFLVDPGIAEFSMVGEAELRAAMPVIARTGLPLLVHAEDPAAIVEAQKSSISDARQYSAYLQSRPDAAETQAVETMIRLCREFCCRVHIVHLASADALPAILRAREEGLSLTVETCPHYLYFASENIRDGATEFKCAPPIRETLNRELLWAALREGVIDLIATDHSPCPPEMKQAGHGDFNRAWGGIVSLSLALPVMWTAASSRGFGIEDIVRWMGEKTAALAGIASRKGRIAMGQDADLVVFDPDESFVVQTSDLHFRHPLTPYLGQQLRGRVKTTFVRGIPVFNDGKLIDSPAGRECTLDGWTPAS